MAEELLRCDAGGEKGLFGALREDEDKVCEIVLLEHLLAGDEQAIFQAAPAAGLGALAFTFRLPGGFDAAFIAMPGRDLDHARHAEPAALAQGPHAFAGPTVEEIVAATRQLPGGSRIERVFFSPIVKLAAEAREQPHRIPAQRLHPCGREFAAIFKGQRAPETASLLRGPQRLERHGVEPAAADAGGGGVEEMFRQDQGAPRVARESQRAKRETQFRQMIIIGTWPDRQIFELRRACL